MSEQPQNAPQDAAPDTEAPAYRAAAAQAVGQVQDSPGTDAGDTVNQIQANPVAAGLSDAEQQIAALLKAAQEQYDRMADQLAAMQRQVDTVRAQAGPPVVQLLARSLATRVQSIANTHPDLGGQHFAGVISQAASLADEVDQAVAGKTSTQRAEQLANGIGTWFTRVHPRLSGKFLEGMHAAVDEAERILEELPALAPLAGAIVQAL